MSSHLIQIDVHYQQVLLVLWRFGNEDSGGVADHGVAEKVQVAFVADAIGGSHEEGVLQGPGFEVDVPHMLICLAKGTWGEDDLRVTMRRGIIH